MSIFRSKMIKKMYIILNNTTVVELFFSSSLKWEMQDTAALIYILRISILDLVSACRDCARLRRR